MSAMNELPSYCLHDHVENFVVTKNFLTASECKDIIQDVKKHKLEDGEIQVKKDLKYGLNQNLRESKIHFISFTNSNFDWLFHKIHQTVIDTNDKYFKFDLVGFQEELQFTEYNAPSGHYSDHTDKLLNGKVRKLSIVIQLTDPSEYEGGELEICLGNVPFISPKEQGTLITFPSYNLHRVKTTTKGTRHSLVGWVTGRPFR